MSANLLHHAVENHHSRGAREGRESERGRERERERESERERGGREIQRERERARRISSVEHEKPKITIFERTFFCLLQRDTRHDPMHILMISRLAKIVLEISPILVNER